jgi:hypothetical protein
MKICLKEHQCFVVMPGLVPGIHDFLFCFQDVDGRDKPGHDELMQFDVTRKRR